jgi:hypothetical protein
MSQVDHSLIEELAAIEHERWASWQSYVHDQCRQNEDGSLTIPVELVVRWRKLIEIPYAELSELEKDGDRVEVYRYLSTVLTRVTVYVLLIHHPHYITTLVYSTPEKAFQAVVEYVRNGWNECYTRRTDYPETPPDDDIEAVKMYFECSTDEWYEIKTRSVT